MGGGLGGWGALMPFSPLPTGEIASTEVFSFGFDAARSIDRAHESPIFVLSAPRTIAPARDAA